MVEPEQSTGDLDPLDPLVGGESTRKSIWPAIYPELLRLVREHRSTIVFVNDRRGAERLALRLNELANADRPEDAPPVEIARAHHGSLAREERTVVEELLKAGELPCLVATSSLELGIDMGAVDLVLQVESPKSVARGLQRIGRAGHNVGDTSKGRIFPKFRADLLECAVVARLMREGRIEPTVVPRNALDVLAQQIVAIAASAEDDGAGGVVPSTSCTRSSPARTPTPSCRARCSRTCSTCSTAATRRRSSPSCGRGSSGTASPGTVRAAQGRAAARGHERRDDPRPRPVRRRPARRPPRRRARRGDGLRGAARARRSCSARPPGGSRRSAATASSSRRRPARPAPCPSGAATRVGRPEAAGRGHRRLQPLGGRPERRGPRPRLRPRPARRPQPPGLPARAAGGDARGPERPHDRRRALPRRDRRLAAVHPHALRRARPRRLGARAERAHPRRVRPGVRRDLVRRRDHRPPARRRRAARARTSCCSSPDELEDLSSPSSAPAPCSARASARTRAARC